MQTKVYFAKVDPGAIIPSKRDEDAGFDIYPCLKTDELKIEPHQTVMVPTGIASVCDKDYCFVLKERGSTGSKGIGQRCGVIDSGYRGEWFVPLTNHNDVPMIIAKPGQPVTMEYGTILYPSTKAICQALVIPVPSVEVCELTLDELKEIESDRGDGALGSSGK